MPSEHTVTGGRYDLAIGRLIDDYPDFYVTGGRSGFGWEAQRRVAGVPRGKALAASSLDELAELMDAARASGPAEAPPE
jgi:hypothetical protein